MLSFTSSEPSSVFVCAQCGLRYGRGGVLTRKGEKTLHFCCYGCSFTYSVLGEQEEAGDANVFLVRLGIAAFLAMNIMALSWAVYDRQWIALGMDEQALPLVGKFLFVLSLPVMIIAGYPFLRNAVEEVRSFRLSMDSLIALGTTAAFLFSSVEAFSGGDRLYFDTATMTLVLVTAGRYLEAHAKVRASGAIKQLLELQPHVARVVRNGREEYVPVSHVEVGTIVKILPGERIPFDGIIVEGGTSVDESLLTGESLPRTKHQGDAVFGATVNIEGVITVRVSTPSSESVHQQIVRLMEQAQQTRSSLQKAVDRIAGLFIPLVIIIAGLTFAGWWLFDGLQAALLHGLTVLVVACPCALGIGAPVATATAIGVAAEHGVLIRSAEVLEKLAGTKIVAFDKTGTLTTGEPSVVSFEAEGDPEETLAIIASVEKESAHPIGRALVRHAAARTLPQYDVRNVTVVPGEGIGGDVLLNGKPTHVVLGTFAMVSSYLGDTPRGDRTTEGGSVYAVWDGMIRARVKVSDAARTSARDAVRMLQALGIDTVMLSGDSEEATQHIAKTVGIAVAHSRLQPQQKYEILRSLKSRGTTVMVGDGINDAPSLAAADVGIALGSATDIAKESADVTIIGDHLEGIPWLIVLAEKTIHTIYWNLLWAFGYNAVGIALAVVGVLQPVIAAGAMIVSSVFVIANSLRLRGSTPQARNEEMRKQFNHSII